MTIDRKQVTHIFTHDKASLQKRAGHQCLRAVVNVDAPDLTSILAKLPLSYSFSPASRKIYFSFHDPRVQDFLVAKVRHTAGCEGIFGS